MPNSAPVRTHHLDSQHTYQSLIIAHRGVPEAARENTLASFDEAWNQNADGIETDVHLTRDGLIVCHHDPVISRTLFGDLEIAKASYKKAKRAFGKGIRQGEHLPLLSEVLETLPEGKRLFIEIKCGPEIVPVLKQILEESPAPPENIAVICFNPEVIRDWKEAVPEVKGFWLSSYLKETYLPYQANTPSGLLKKARTANADGISIEQQESLDKTLVQYLNNQGLEVHVWTVDTPQQASWYRGMGLHSITTNHPEKVREYFSRNS